MADDFAGVKRLVRKTCWAYEGQQGARGMMATDSNVVIAMIAAVAGFATALLGAVVGVYNNSLARRNEAHAEETKAAVQTIKAQTDGMTERGEALAKKVGVLEGHAQGMADAGTVPVMLVPQPAAEVKKSLLDKLTGK
jgi:hypothetical protein